MNKIHLVRVPMERIARSIGSLMLEMGMKPPAQTVLFQAVCASIVVFILSVLYILYSVHHSTRTRCDAVLLVGVTGTSDNPSPGKTTLYKTLRNGHPPKLGTVSSMDTTEAVFAPSPTVALPTRPDQPVRWVDIPGHARLSGIALEEHLPRARCVVLVVDGSAFGTTARTCAGLLHDVLVDPNVRRHNTPVLVFCNKSDIRGCVTPAAVRTRLQAELERIRVSRRRALTDSAGKRDDTDSAVLGFDGTPFTFDHASSPVTFASGSAYKRDVMAVVNFVRSSFL